MSNTGNMGYRPTPKSPAPGAAPVDEGPQIYEVPLRPVPTIPARIGGRDVVFTKPKLAGMRIVAKHGKALMAAAELMSGGDVDDLDPDLIEAQFEALDKAELVLRGVVPYMVADKDQRVWVIQCFDNPEIDQAELINVLLTIMGRVNSSSAAEAVTAATEAAAAADEADAGAEAAASIPSIAPGEADVVVEVVEIDPPGAAAA
jgi:hypothetical protein